MAERRDPRELVDRLEVVLLGEKPSLTGQQVADAVGVTFEDARLRWRSLGFSAVEPDVPEFTPADVEALRLTQQMLENGMLGPEDEPALIRSLGRSFARLAEWQMGMLETVVDAETMSADELRALMADFIPTVESLQSYVWRRHILAAASRLLLAPPAGVVDETGTTMGVGFADIVNYTWQSRFLTRGEIGQLVDHFERRSLEIITANGGRIIKTLGDELLFVADQPTAIARIGLELAEESDQDERFPQVRVGLAWGPALARFGDVLGPVVNVASRLTSRASPGRVVTDRDLADELKGNKEFKLRRVRRASVRGYRRLEVWSLRRPPASSGSTSEVSSTR